MLSSVCLRYGVKGVLPAKRTMAPALGLLTSSIIERASSVSCVRATEMPSSLRQWNAVEFSAILEQCYGPAAVASMLLLKFEWALLVSFCHNLLNDISF